MTEKAGHTVSNLANIYTDPQAVVPLQELRSIVERLRGGLQMAFLNDKAAPRQFYFARWAYLPDPQTEALWLCISLQSQRLHWQQLKDLSHPDLLRWLSTQDVVGLPVRSFEDQNFGFGFGVQLRAPRIDLSQLVKPKLPEKIAFRFPKPIQGTLPFCFGETTSGPYFHDLAAPYHILIGGLTSMGKTGIMQASLVSLLMFQTPDQLQIAIVDPKRQFGAFEAVPHLTQRVTNLDAAIRLVDNISQEAARRQTIFEQHGAQSIDEYNEQAETKMPYLLLVVDELLELSLSNRFDALIRNLIALGSSGRSAGIRLMIAATSTDAKTIDTRLRNQCAYRIAVACKGTYASKAVLGDDHPEAGNLPTIPGRCLIGDPTLRDLLEVQAYHMAGSVLRSRIAAIASRYSGVAVPQGDGAWPVTDEDKLDWKIGAFCINQCGGFFETTRIVQQFHLRNTVVGGIASRWDRAGWLGPSGGSKRGKVTALFVEKVARVSAPIG